MTSGCPGSDAGKAGVGVPSSPWTLSTEKLSTIGLVGFLETDRDDVFVCSRRISVSADSVFLGSAAEVSRSSDPSFSSDPWDRLRFRFL